MSLVIRASWSKFLAPVLILLSCSAAIAAYDYDGKGRVRDGVYRNSDFSDDANTLPLIQIIESARTSLDIEIYTMTNGHVRKALRDALARRVRVRVVQDATPAGGTSCDPFGLESSAPSPSDPEGKPSADCRDLRRMVKQIQDSPGGAYVPYNKANLCGGNSGTNCFQHGKMVIADGSVVLISTGNFNSSNLCDLSEKPSVCNRDYSYVERDPAIVSTLVTIFERDLKGAKYDIAQVMDAAGPAVNARLTVSPLSRKPIFDFLKSARRSILIQNQYLKDKQMNALLEVLSSQGIDVRVNVASLCAFGKPSETQAKNLTDLYTVWDAKGIVTRMFTKQVIVSGKPGYLHAKAIVIDGDKAWVGSVNGSTSAIDYNREFGMFTEIQAEVRALQNWIQSDLNDRGGESWRESLNCEKDDA